ncbi:MAG: hypothetical protein RLZZ408_60 [Verrucomicrobiota bacterium]
MECRTWKDALIKSHRGRCGKNGPRARRLGASIPAVGCKRQAYTAPGLLSPQPEGLKSFVDFCSVARSGETTAGIAQHSRLQKSANGLQRPSWDFISASLKSPGCRPLCLRGGCDGFGSCRLSWKAMTTRGRHHRFTRSTWATRREGSKETKFRAPLHEKTSPVSRSST